MFTGIIETLGEVTEIKRNKTNVDFRLKSSITGELKIDQSLAHNGVCLTVVEISGDEYVVTAIDETLKRTNLNKLNVGSIVNLERCTKVGDRLDGHIVQGHVDTTATCKKIEDFDGSKKFFFEYNTNDLTVEKGSVTVNGTSLTVVDSEPNLFSVAIIPYTLDNTVFKTLKVGDKVNIEFDIVGKYVSKLLNSRN